MASRSDSPKRVDVASLVELGKRGDDDACLDYLRDLRFPDGAPCPGCGRRTRFHRVRGRSAYACQYCRHHVYPMAQTIFGRSKTPLHSWFGAIAAVDSRRDSVTVAQLQRELGVTRKTAARLRALILPIVKGGNAGLLATTASHALSSGQAEDDERRPAPAEDSLREELVASISGLREELEEAEARARAASAEVEELRDAIINLEVLIGARPARSQLRVPRSPRAGA